MLPTAGDWVGETPRSETLHKRVASRIRAKIQMCSAPLRDVDTFAFRDACNGIMHDSHAGTAVNPCAGEWHTVCYTLGCALRAERKRITMGKDRLIQLYGGPCDGMMAVDGGGPEGRITIGKDAHGWYVVAVYVRTGTGGAARYEYHTREATVR